MAPIEEKVQKLQFISNLLGRKRSVMEKEVQQEQDNPSYASFDLLAQMIENKTNLERELYTETIELQNDTESTVKEIYEQILDSGELPILYREKHLKYLNMALGSLPDMFTGLDASQPWILYWVINSIYVIGSSLPQEKLDEAGDKIIKLIHPDGGIGGGPGQLGHAAASYGGILTLALTRNEKLWAHLDRKKFYQWLLALKQPDGSFVMHVGGEKDTRAVYCCLVIASLLDILTDELTQGTAEWLSRCQTFEGGFGGVPFDEAHGGYTFCAVAALIILGRDVFLQNANLEALISWTVTKQLRLEGGFCGRSNKLVDGCYSFWVGGLLPVFDVLVGKIELTSRAQLQHYVLACCQNNKFGGLRDKPGKHPDFYHSNYVLLGLAIAQNKFYVPEGELDIAYHIQSKPIEDISVCEVRDSDRVQAINPVFALPQGVPNLMKAFFQSL